MGYLKVDSSHISLRGSVDKTMQVDICIDEIQSRPYDLESCIEEVAYDNNDGEISDVNVDGWYVYGVVEEAKYNTLQNQHRELMQDLLKMTSIKQVQKRLKQVKI